MKPKSVLDQKTGVDVSTTCPSSLEPERVGLLLVDAFARPLLTRKRSDRFGLVEPHPGIELPGQDRRAIMAPAFGLWAVDDADEPLEPRLHQFARQPVVALAFTQIEQEARHLA